MAARTAPSEADDERQRMRANRSTPLIEACIANDAPRVMALLEAKTRVNSADDNGVTALLHACRGGSLDIVTALLKHGATGWLADSTGQTALMRAALHGHAHLVEPLLRGGCRVNEVQADGSSAMHFAAGRGHSAVVQRLLAFRGDACLKRADGWTPLLLAAAAGHVDTVKCLVDEGGAAVDDRTEHGWTPLAYACLNTDADMLRVLLAAGADADEVDETDGTTPLMAACEDDDDGLAIAAALVAAGADVNRCAHDGRCALSIAAQAGCEATVKWLLEHGASLSVPSDGEVVKATTPLVSAVQGANVAIVRLLMQRGAPVSQPTAAGVTPLAAACATGSTELVQLLLGAGASRDELWSADGQQLKAGVRVHPRVAAMFHHQDRCRQRLALLRLLLLCRDHRAVPCLPAATAAATTTPVTAGRAAVVAATGQAPMSPAQAATSVASGAAAAGAVSSLARRVAATLTDACVGAAATPRRVERHGKHGRAIHAVHAHGHLTVSGQATKGKYHHMFGENRGHVVPAPGASAAAPSPGSPGSPRGVQPSDTTPGVSCDLPVLASAGAGAGAGAGGDQVGRSEGYDYEHAVATQVSRMLVTRALSAVAQRPPPPADDDDGGGGARVPAPAVAPAQSATPRGNSTNNSSAGSYTLDTTSACVAGDPATLSVWLLATRLLGGRFDEADVEVAHATTNSNRQPEPTGGAPTTQTTHAPQERTWAVPAAGRASLLRQVLRFL